MERANTTTLGFNDLIDLGDVDRILEKVQKLCKAKLVNKVLPGMEHDDVIQEVSIKVFRSLDDYDSNIAKASTYFDNIINNMIKDCYKKAMSSKNLLVCNAMDYDESGTDEGEAPSMTVGVDDSGYSNTEFLIDVMDNMGLTEKEKEIFQMRSAGLEFQEIANAFGVSKARMSQMWAKVKNKYNNM